MTVNLKSIRLALLVAAGLSLSSPAVASSLGPGLATDISTAADGSVWFLHNGPRQGALPSCTVAEHYWAFSVNTPAGQAMLANLLAATASGKTVQIQGSGTCLGAYETVAWIVGM